LLYEGRLIPAAVVIMRTELEEGCKTEIDLRLVDDGWCSILILFVGKSAAIISYDQRLNSTLIGKGLSV